MATPEQLRQWMGVIREGSPVRLFPGTNRAFEVSPAEKNRYEANAAFGQILVQDLEWLVSAQGPVTEDELKERQQKIVNTLQNQDLRCRFERITNRLVQLMHDTQKIGKKELLHRAQAFLDTEDVAFQNFRFSHVDPEDITITPFGAITVTIRDAQMWERELQLSPTLFGIKIRYLPDPEPKSLEETATPRQRDAVNRLLFFHSSKKEISEIEKAHELFHDLYHRVFKSEMGSRYPGGVEQEIFFALRNELIAYALSQQWKPTLGLLLANNTSFTDVQMRKEIYEQILKMCQSNAMSVVQAEERARCFVRMLLQVQSELARLAIVKGKEFQRWIGCILASEDLKELVYHLTTINPGPIDASRSVRRLPDGGVAFEDVYEFARNVISYGIPVDHLSELLERIRVSIQKQTTETELAQKQRVSWRRLLEALEKHGESTVST